MVCILLGEGFEEMEAIVSADILRRAGVETYFLAIQDREVTGGQGITVTADLTLDEVDLEQLEMLVLPGGMTGVENIQMNLFATALIQGAYDRGRYLAAICAAPTILAHMGLLDRRKAICYPGMEEDMGSAVVQLEKTIVTDGKIITARAPGSAYEFALQLVTVLKGETAAQSVRQSIYYEC